MAVKELEIKEIVVDKDLQFREVIDPEVVARYVDCLGALPPVEVIDVDGKMTMVDGFHRLEAFKAAGETMIVANIWPGTLQDAKKTSALANISHGLPLLRPERDKAILFLESIGASHSEIGHRFGIDASRVSQICTGAGQRRRDPSVQEQATKTKKRTTAKKTPPAPPEQESPPEDSGSPPSDEGSEKPETFQDQAASQEDAPPNESTQPDEPEGAADEPPGIDPEDKTQEEAEAEAVNFTGPETANVGGREHPFAVILTPEQWLVVWRLLGLAPDLWTPEVIPEITKTIEDRSWEVGYNIVEVAKAFSD